MQSDLGISVLIHSITLGSWLLCQASNDVLQAHRWFKNEANLYTTSVCSGKSSEKSSSTCFSWRISDTARNCENGPLVRYVKLGVAHALGLPGMFSPPPRVSDLEMHHGMCVTHVPWCMPGSLSNVFLWSPWRGKCFRYYRRIRNPQLYVFDKRPIPSGGPFFNHRLTRIWAWICYDVHYSPWDVITHSWPKFNGSRWC